MKLTRLALAEVGQLSEIEPAGSGPLLSIIASVAAVSAPQFYKRLSPEP